MVEVAAGLVDANLGGNIYKKRLPMSGRGKSGGARVLIATKLAEALLDMDLRSLENAIQAGELTEICDEEEPHTV